MPRASHTDDHLFFLFTHPDRQLLVGAALTELRGKELQVATDSDCALIVERMIWNMGDFGRRVFADALMGK